MQILINILKEWLSFSVIILFGCLKYRRKEKSQIQAKKVLTERQLQRLSEHKYRTTGTSLLDPLMQRFWEWVTSHIPLWLAPNLLTLSGLIVNLITVIILIFYSPDAKQVIPCWTPLLFVVGLFIYQTLDACDGKQARRTCTSNPLGELMDHGCDSLSIIFVCLSVGIVVQLGFYPGWMFYQSIAASTVFYIAHWQAYVSSLLRFNKFDVTEAQYIVMLIHLISATWGCQIWSTEVPFLNCELKIIPALLAVVGHVMMLFRYFSVILSGGVGKNGSTVAGTSILSPFIPIAIVVISAFIIGQKSSPHLYEKYPCLYLLFCCIVIAKITNKLVIAHMTRSEMSYLDSVLIGPAMLFLNQYFNNFLPEYLLLWVALIYTIIDFIHYSVIVCNQIASFLKVNILTISPCQILNLPKSDKPDRSSVNEKVDYTRSLLLPANNMLMDVDDEEQITTDRLLISGIREVDCDSNIKCSNILVI